MAQPSDWGRFLAAIRAQESGGNYSQDTAGCLGAYCWSTQAGWDTMAQGAGQSKYVGVNPSQVPASVQDTVASSNLYKVYQQTHSLLDAAMWWNGGSTSSQPNPGLPAQPWAKQCGGGSSRAYACQVLARMGLGGHYLAGGGTGATSVGGSGAGGVVTLTAAQQADCALGFNTGNLNPIPSWVPGLGGNVTLTGCFLSKSEVRGILGVANIVLGAAVVGVGLGFVAAFTRPGRQVLGIVTSVVPGGQVLKGAGAAEAGAGGVGSRLTQAQVKQARTNAKNLGKGQTGGAGFAAP